MKLYDKIISSIKSKFSNNESVSGNIAAELTLIFTLLLSCLLLRHINVLLTVVIILGLAIVLLTNMPLIPKFKSEQDDSLNKMLFYGILTFGILITLIYWGGNLV
jgi:energy-converting hydrogenase B subunit G